MIATSKFGKAELMPLKFIFLEKSLGIYILLFHKFSLRKGPKNSIKGSKFYNKVFIPKFFFEENHCLAASAVRLDRDS